MEGDVGFSVRSRGAFVFSRQHLLQQARGERKKNFLEPRQRLGDRWSRARAGTDANELSVAEILRTTVQGNGGAGGVAAAGRWFMALEPARSGGISAEGNERLELLCVRAGVGDQPRAARSQTVRTGRPQRLDCARRLRDARRKTGTRPAGRRGSKEIRPDAQRRVRH